MSNGNGGAATSTTWGPKRVGAVNWGGGVNAFGLCSGDSSGVLLFGCRVTNDGCLSQANGQKKKCKPKRRRPEKKKSACFHSQRRR